MTNYKLPALRVEVKIFTIFVFKLIFRVAEEVCHEIYLYLPNVQVYTIYCNFQVLSLKAY